MRDETNQYGDGSGVVGPQRRDPVLVASVRDPQPNARIHAMPCSISYDGPAAVNTYFMPRDTTACETGMSAANKKATSRNGEEGAEGFSKRAKLGKEELLCVEGRLYEAQFRGRFLRGTGAACPQGMRGFVVRERVLPLELKEVAPSAALNRYWSIESEFRELTLWRHDFAPPPDHCLQQVEDWRSLAHAVLEMGRDGTNIWSLINECTVYISRVSHGSHQ